jgi:predicted GIY-YIG superfamily endonuclease
LQALGESRRVDSHNNAKSADHSVTHGSPRILCYEERINRKGDAVQPEAEKYFQKKNRDKKFARWFVFLVFGLPFAIFIGLILGGAIR